MKQPSHDRPDPLAVRPDPAKAARACRQLIRANTSPSGDMDKALASALEAFGMTTEFLDTEGGRWQ